MANERELGNSAARLINQSGVAAIAFVHLAETEDAFDATTLAEHAELFEVYVKNMPYKAGQKRRNSETDPTLYKCITTHGAEHAATNPSENPLWERIANPADPYPEWFPATGTFDQWMLGDKCAHSGKHWTSNVNNNVWEPGTPGAPWTQEN